MRQEAKTMYNHSMHKAKVVSFDIAREDGTRRTIIHRLIYGRIETKILGGTEKTYRYPGLLDEGGFRMGQSVFLFPPNLAFRLIEKLKELKVDHRHWDVWVSGEMQNPKN